MHLGLDLDQCETNYHKFGNVDVTWHSGAPEGQEYVEFRLITHPQRRIYVYCQTATKKIVSVSYEKSGQDETFSGRRDPVPHRPQSRTRSAEDRSVRLGV
jgi:hypothetical protein